MLCVRCLLLVLLFADWACDTQFGNSFLCQPMASSQVTLSQAIGSGGIDQHRERAASPLICQALPGPTNLMLESASLAEPSRAPWPQSCKLTYVLMSVRC